MDPANLIGPANPAGYPAPYWFLVMFKVLGFVLHMVPMHLWYAGIVLAMLFRWRGRAAAQQWSGRIMVQMPIVIALGINFGIVPLLFLQVAYYRAFYPATALMAWPWLSILGLLGLAYYGVYYYAVGLHADPVRLGWVRRTVGWTAAVLFIAVGFLFANGLSLMTNVDAWPALWERTSVAAAPLGVALNTADPAFWPRWLMMFGLALTTTAVYTLVDAGYFARQEDEGYRQWAPTFACKLYTVGLVWYVVAGLWYVQAGPAELRQAMFGGFGVILTALTVLGPVLTWLLIRSQQQTATTRRMALNTALAQFGVLGLNAISRQIGQNAELAPYMDVTTAPVNVQWGPLALFLLLFVAGLGVIAWIIVQVVAATRHPADQAVVTGLPTPAPHA